MKNIEEVNNKISDKFKELYDVVTECIPDEEDFKQYHLYHIKLKEYLKNFNKEIHTAHVDLHFKLLYLKHNTKYSEIKEVESVTFSS